MCTGTSWLVVCRLYVSDKHTFKLDMLHIWYNVLPSLLEHHLLTVSLKYYNNSSCTVHSTAQAMWEMDWVSMRASHDSHSLYIKM